MKNNSQNQQFDKSPGFEIKNSDKLDILSGVVTALGYVIGVLSTIASIQEEQENPKQSEQIQVFQQEHLRQLNQMQNQLDHLSRQIALIERRTR
ncbi:hypothetical protein ACWV26_06140 [Rummeliibacillus sp. JY-2-4R]